MLSAGSFCRRLIRRSMLFFSSGDSLPCSDLGGEHEVDAERASLGRDVHEFLQEVLRDLEHAGELVEDHDDPGQPGQRGLELAGAPVVVDLARRSWERIASLRLISARTEASTRAASASSKVSAAVSPDGAG